MQLSDAGYMESTANGVMQVTAWVPLVDATKDTGCVEVLDDPRVRNAHLHIM